MVELTILLMISSEVAIKVVAHTQTGRIVSSGATTDRVSTSASNNWDLLESNFLVKVSHLCIYKYTIFVIQGRIRFYSSFAPSLSVFQGGLSAITSTIIKWPC